MSESDELRGAETVGANASLRLTGPYNDPRNRGFLNELNQELAQGLTTDLAKVLARNHNALIIPPQVDNSLWEMLASHYADQGLATNLAGDPRTAHQDINAAIDCEQFGLPTKDIIAEYGDKDWVAALDEQYPREHSYLGREVPFSSFVKATKLSVIIETIKDLEEGQRLYAEGGSSVVDPWMLFAGNQGSKRDSALLRSSLYVEGLNLEKEVIVQALDIIFGKTKTAQGFKQRGEFDLADIQPKVTMQGSNRIPPLDTLVRPRRTGK